MFTLGRTVEEIPAAQPAGIPEIVLAAPPRNSLRVLTWNVLAPSPRERFVDAIGLASPGKQRARGLIETIKRVGPDIVALQEVTDGFMAVLEEDPAHWDDAWTRLRPSDTGHTYDLEANRLAQNNAFTAESSRRLDRILVSGRLRPVDVGLIGRAPKQAVSDHFGVWADLEASPP